MRILFVTRDFIGLRSMLFEGSTVPKGLLPNVKILEALVKRGDEVDLVVACYEHRESKAQFPVPVAVSLKSFQKIKKTILINRPPSVAGKVLFALRLPMLIRKMLGASEYDFVYFHGNLGLFMTPKVLSRKIAVGVRAYGSHIGFWLREKGYLWTLIRHYPEIAMIKSKKSFLLATNYRLLAVPS